MCKSNLWIRCVQTPPIILILGKALSTTTKEIHTRISAMSSPLEIMSIPFRCVARLEMPLVEKPKTLCLLCSMLSIAPIPIHSSITVHPTTSLTHSTVWQFLKLAMSALVAFCSSPRKTSQTITLLIKVLMISLLPMTLSSCPQTACFIWNCFENKPTFHWDASFKQVKIESGWVITATQLVWKYFRLTFPTV